LQWAGIFSTENLGHASESDRPANDAASSCEPPVSPEQGGGTMRSDLRLADLGKEPAPSKLMNVQIPAHVSEAIDSVARDLGCSKTSAVIALLNEGLDSAHVSLRGFRPKSDASQRKRRGRPGRAKKK
jgi:hypothetical protein